MNHLDLMPEHLAMYGPTYAVEIGQGFLNSQEIRVSIKELKAVDKELNYAITMNLKPDYVERFGRALIAEAKIARRKVVGK